MLKPEAKVLMRPSVPTRRIRPLFWSTMYSRPAESKAMLRGSSRRAAGAAPPAPGEAGVAAAAPSPGGAGPADRRDHTMGVDPADAVVVGVDDVDVPGRVGGDRPGRRQPGGGGRPAVAAEAGRRPGQRGDVTDRAGRGRRR